MSHTVMIRGAWKASELPQLKEAFKTLGWKIVGNSTIRNFEGHKREFPLVALNPETGAQAYDVGIQMKVEEDRLTLHSDFYGGSIARTLGNDFVLLKQEYANAIIHSEFPNAVFHHEMDAKGNRLVTAEIWG